jgi:hypothetical protein
MAGVCKGVALDGVAGNIPPLMVKMRGEPSTTTRNRQQNFSYIQELCASGACITFPSDNLGFNPDFPDTLLF